MRGCRADAYSALPSKLRGVEILSGEPFVKRSLATIHIS